MLLDFIVKNILSKHTSTLFCSMDLFSILKIRFCILLFCQFILVIFYRRRTYFLNRNRLLSFIQSYCFILQQMYAN